MAIKVDLLKQYCIEAGHTLIKEGDNDIFFQCTKIGEHEIDIKLIAILRDEGKMFEMATGGFVSTETIQRSEHKAAFLYYLLNFAWNTPFGTPELNNDGELSFLLEMPLEDNTLTYQQFNKIVDGMVRMSASLSVAVNSILKTGKLPENNANKPTAEATLIALLSALADPNTPEETMQRAIEAANELLGSENVSEQIKLLIRAAIGASIRASIPDSI